jgi:hypothetical protein
LAYLLRILDRKGKRAKRKVSLSFSLFGVMVGRRRRRNMFFHLM